MACSGPGFDPPATAGDPASHSGGTTTNGGTGGGLPGGGGFSAGGGSTATGGALPTTGGELTGSGGTSNESGGIEAPSMPGGCRADVECEGTDSRCVLPGESWTPPAFCDAPAWCGECDCPEMPELPSGAGTACQQDGDCQAISTDLVCSPQGVCSRCGEDADCSAAAPRCAIPAAISLPGEPLGYRRCVECVTHDDCGGLTPACDTTVTSDGQSWGRCVECAPDLPCGKGKCAAGMCLPECDDDVQCGGDGVRYCSNLNRCEPTPCTTDAECGEFGLCGASGCERRSCDEDSDCGEEKACVKGACFAAGGSCVDPHAPWTE